MFTGIVHRDANGTFWFDDLPVRGPKDLPTGRAWAGTLWYAPEGIRASDWASLMRPGDLAYGPRQGEIMGVDFRVGKRGRMKVMRSSAWGVNARDPNVCAKELTWLMAEAAAADMKVRGSVASTAVQLYLDRFDGTADHPKMRQLPSRWRGMAHAALHGGPIAVLQGGADRAVHIDVHRAYLAALREDVPVVGFGDDGRTVGGWWTTDDLRWERVRRHFGFVDATVRCRGDLHDPTGLPPLPVHLGCGAVYPTGTFRGIWTIAQVCEAEERGEVDVLTVHQYAFCNRRQPLFAELAATFDALPGPLAKRCYTRFWGKLGMRGGFVGELRDGPVEGEIPAAGLWWKYAGIDLGDPRAPSTYRPDLAAFVTAFNHRQVMASTRRLLPGSIVAVHVDAIWTTDVDMAHRLCVEGGTSVGGWRVKRDGPLRFYGIGAYSHAGHVAASGYDVNVHGELTEDRLRRWVTGAARTRRRLLLDTRAWSGDPAFSARATSRPCLYEQDASSPSPAEGPSVYDACWTPSGWMRQPDAPVAVVADASEDPPTVD